MRRSRTLYEVCSIGFLAVATVASIVAIRRGIPDAWVLLVVPLVIFVVITALQLQPATSLNLASKVASENVSSLGSAVGMFLTQIKSNLMLTIAYVALFVVHPGPPAILLLVVGAVVVVTIAAVASLFRKVAELA